MGVRNANLGSTDVELERLLVSGGELLRQDRVSDAQAAFHDALARDPDNARALGLLGLACFRLNDFAAALPVYQQLVALNRNDASYALNLGLVYLKLGNAQDAIRELQRSRELDPSQSRAVSYLGLAYARTGDYASAYQVFLQAGQTDLAREMEQYLGEAQRAEIIASVSSRASRPAATPPADAPRPAGPLAPPTGSASQPAPPAGHRLTPAERAAIISAATTAEFEEIGDADVEDLSDDVVPRPVRGIISQRVAQAVPSAAATAGAARVAIGSRPPQPLSEFATSQLIRPEDGDHTFETSTGGVLIVRVRGRVYTRTEGVTMCGGELAYEAASRRVRGASTGEPFSGDGRPLFVVTGTGHLIASPLGQHFSAVTLDEDILYLREDLVYAFEEQLRWENGQVPGSAGRLRMVQFRGQGAVAFRSRRPLLAIKLAPERVLYVDADVLAGWIGRVIPRAVAPVAGGEKSALFVECTGEGVVLIDEQESGTWPAARPAPAQVHTGDTSTSVDET